MFLEVLQKYKLNVTLTSLLQLFFILQFLWFVSNSFCFKTICLFQVFNYILFWLCSFLAVFPSCFALTFLFQCYCLYVTLWTSFFWNTMHCFDRLCVIVWKQPFVKAVFSLSEAVPSAAAATGFVGVSGLCRGKFAGPTFPSWEGSWVSCSHVTEQAPCLVKQRAHG